MTLAYSAFILSPCSIHVTWNVHLENFEWDRRIDIEIDSILPRVVWVITGTGLLLIVNDWKWMDFLGYFIKR